MPRGVPRIGNRASSEATTGSEPKVLGSIPETTLNPNPAFSGWTEPDGTRIEIEEPPPPWETASYSRLHDTDARRFVKVPDNWELRWINPRLIDQLGWRDWQPVMKSDPRVKVLVSEMISPEGNIRRGGPGGPILAWMYKSWVESRRRMKAERSARQRARAVDMAEQAKEAVARSGAGRYISVDSVRHPTHTIGDGRTMTGD